MEKEIIETQTVSFNDVKNNIVIDHDDYNIAHDGMREQLVKVIFSSPFLSHYEQPMFLFSRYNNVVGGRVMHYPTKMVIDGEECDAMCGSDLYVEDNLRQKAIGVDLMLYPINQKYYDYTLSAGLSPMAYRINKRLPKTTLFEIPKLSQFRNVRSIFHHIGIKGKWLTFLCIIPNLFVRLYIHLITSFFSKSKKGFVLKKLTQIPQWVDGIVLNDGHKYKELHNHLWMQWVHDNNFWPNNQNNSDFIAIYKDEQPMGFFLIKVRCIDDKKSMKNFKIGSLLEWGSVDETILSEETITKMAVAYFNKDIDICQFTSKNESLIKLFKRYGFFEIDKANICFRDLRKKHKDCNDINKWRIRLGYADTVFY